MSTEPKTDIWMPLYIGDYLADTAHLDAERSGCYLHWLMHYWRKGPLPNDVAVLAQVGKLRRADAPSITQALLADFFTLAEDGYWHQKRVDLEMATWNAKAQKRREKASKAGRARWPKDDAPSTSQVLLEQCPSPSPLPSPVKQKTTTLARSVPPEELAGTLPLVDGTDYPISRRQIDEWSQAYPAVDVKGELRRFKVWLDANPTRRKTQRGMARAIVQWLSRAQDKSMNGGTDGNRAYRTKSDANDEAVRRAIASILAEDVDGPGSSETDGGRIDLLG